MTMRTGRLRYLIVLAVSSFAVTGHAQPPLSRTEGGIKTLSRALSNRISCDSVGMEVGDAAKEPSIVVERYGVGCAIPWHWHTPIEHIMMVAGTLSFEEKGKPVQELSAGDFLLIPSRRISRARCVGTTPCIDFLYTDGPFDMHFVDEAGKEISPEEARKANQK
jgi:hypothetical protein